MHFFFQREILFFGFFFQVQVFDFKTMKKFGFIFFYQVDATLFYIFHIFCYILNYWSSWQQGHFEGQLSRKYDVFFFLNITVRVYLPPQNKTRETQCFLRDGQEQQHLNKQHTQRSSDHRTGNKMHQAEEIPLRGESWCMASREIQRKLCADSDWLLWKSWMNFLPGDRWGRWVSNPRWCTLLDAISLTEWRVFSVSSCSRHQSSSSRVSMASCWCGSSATHEHSKALWEMHLKVWEC